MSDVACEELQRRSLQPGTSFGEAGKSVRIAPVESFNPRLNKFAWFHAF